jgi:hypothetical protein
MSIRDILTAMASANLALRFLLEVGVLAALGLWGFHTGRGPITAAGLGIGAPLLAAVVWGTFGAPGATVSTPGPAHLLLETAVFGSAAAALATAEHPALAWVFASAVVINRVLMFAWGQ